LVPGNNFKRLLLAIIEVVHIGRFIFTCLDLLDCVGPDKLFKDHFFAIVSLL